MPRRRRGASARDPRRRAPALRRPGPSPPRAASQQLRPRRRLGDAVRLVVVVEERVGLLGLAGELAQRLDPLAQLVLGVACSRSAGPRRRRACSTSPALRPWKRTYAIGAVAATTVRGTLRGVELRRVDRHVRHAALLEPAQHLLDDALLEPRRVPELDQHRGRRRAGRPPTRGSRATTASRRRTAAAGRGSRRACRPRAAARARRGTRGRPRRAARAAGGRRGRGRRPACPSRRSGGSCSSRTGWRVIRPNAFTCITNPGGVRSAQPCTIFSSGTR